MEEIKETHLCQFEKSDNKHCVNSSFGPFIYCVKHLIEEERNRCADLVSELYGSKCECERLGKEVGYVNACPVHGLVGEGGGEGIVGELMDLQLKILRPIYAEKNCGRCANKRERCRVCEDALQEDLAEERKSFVWQE